MRSNLSAGFDLMPIQMPCRADYSAVGATSWWPSARLCRSTGAGFIVSGGVYRDVSPTDFAAGGGGKTVLIPSLTVQVGFKTVQFLRKTVKGWNKTVQCGSETVQFHDKTVKG